MTHAVLVLNSGSSSIKYQLLELDGSGRGERRAVGLVDRIGGAGPGTLTHQPAGAQAYELRRVFPDHEQALAAVLAAFREAGPDLAGAARPVAVGHRVVHGGTRFSAPTVLDDEVVDTIRDLIPLAPLHNSVNLSCILAARGAFPDVPHVAVFDTAFHQTIPPAAHTYAVPREWREQFAVRRYGFHGTSHEYVSRRAADFLGRAVAETNVIVLHLGNGASACAVEAGRSVETSMGLTPLEGLVMGTRSGDLDPAVPSYLQRVAGLDAEAVDHILNHSSGLHGLGGSNDLRDLNRSAAAGDPDARLAIDVYCHRIRKYVGSYYAVLGRVDAIVFTAGVGEHDAGIRAQAMSGLEHLGVKVDAELNGSTARGERSVSPPGSPVPVLVIPTDEEIEIARQTLDAARVDGA